MRAYKDDFDIKKPFRVIAVEKANDVKYKITQPLKIPIFGYSVRYYDVCEWSLRERYKSTKYFKDKKEIDSFIETKFTLNKPKTETIVFDSLKEELTIKNK